MKRVLGAIGMVLGVIGIVVSLGLLVGVWIGRGVVNTELASIVDGIDGRLQRVDAALDQVAIRLETAQAHANEATTAAMQLGQGPLADGPVVDALRATTDQLTDSSADLREWYVTAREGILDAHERLDQLRQLFPRLPIPALPDDRLQTLDQRLRDLNASLVRLRTELGTRQGPGEQLRDRVVTATSNVATAIGGAASLVADARSGVADTRSGLAETQATVERWVNVASIVASALCLYGVLLNVCLFVVGRSWFRPSAAVLLTA